jgi:hypothetical protein
MVASDNMTNTAHVTKGFQVLDHTSVEPQPELVATEQKAVCPAKPNEKDVAAPLALKGWKLEPEMDSYAAFAIQEAIDADIAKYPSLDAATQRNISTKFRALHQRVHDEGYYQCHYSNYVKEIVRYVALFSIFLMFIHFERYILAGLAMGIFWQQIMFTAHDAGHCGITHNYVIDSLIGIFIGNFVCGLSIGWWKSSHNVHHFVTNDPVNTHGKYQLLQNRLTRLNRYTTQTRKTFPCLLYLRAFSPLSNPATTMDSNLFGTPLPILPSSTRSTPTTQSWL